MDDDVRMFDTVLSEFEHGQSLLDKKLSSALESLNASFNAMDALSSEGRRQAGDAQNLFSLMRDLRPHLTSEEAMSYDIRLSTVRRRLERWKQVETRRGTVCWRLFLGERANTKIWKRSDLFAMKNAYNAYKSTMNIIFLLFPLVELLICANRFVIISHQIWLLYFYVSLSLRESLLLCNGSRIEPWWIIHHYIASAICIVNLTWPDGPGYQFFIQHFATLMVWQAMIMMLQAQYQNRRHYVRTSLGKAGELDIPSPETLVEKPADLLMLVPLLYITYGLQLFTGITLLVKSRQWSEGFWNMLCNGLLITLLGIGNSIATMRVLSKKRTERRRLSVERQKSS